MEINGIAHIMLTVSDFEACRPFYGKLLEYFGLTPVVDGDGYYYCVGGRTAVGVTRAEEKHRDERFEQRRVGLHHVCFRVRERGDIDDLYGFLQEIDAKIIHPPEDGAFAPGYYSILFEDPDGIRLEVNHVPGKGLLADK
jgi:catechol 2,3-dioxygenase-like lactoylglutathione lyase family enzyme